MQNFRNYHVIFEIVFFSFILTACPIKNKRIRVLRKLNNLLKELFYKIYIYISLHMFSIVFNLGEIGVVCQSNRALGHQKYTLFFFIV
jgi:hypothetical protein